MLRGTQFLALLHAIIHNLCATGAIIGVGLTEGWRGISWKQFARQFTFWVMTLAVVVCPAASNLFPAFVFPHLAKGRRCRKVVSGLPYATRKRRNILVQSTDSST